VAIEFEIPAKVDLPDISVELKEASPPEVLQITITGVDIEKGIPGNTRRCPVANAVRRSPLVEFGNIDVTPTNVILYQGGPNLLDNIKNAIFYEIPEQLTRAILNFDRWKEFVEDTINCELLTGTFELHKREIAYTDILKSFVFVNEEKITIPFFVGSKFKVSPNSNPLQIPKISTPNFLL
jgi:hypothetical protein